MGVRELIVLGAYGLRVTGGLGPLCGGGGQASCLYIYTLVTYLIKQHFSPFQ
jgi:hypothetical protein